MFAFDLWIWLETLICQHMCEEKKLNWNLKADRCLQPIWDIHRCLRLFISLKFVKRPKSPVFVHSKADFCIKSIWDIHQCTTQPISEKTILCCFLAFFVKRSKCNWKVVTLSELCYKCQLSWENLPTKEIGRAHFREKSLFSPNAMPSCETSLGVVWWVARRELC